MGSLKSRDKRRVIEGGKKPWEMRLIPIFNIKIPFTKVKKKRPVGALWYAFCKCRYITGNILPV